MSQETLGYKEALVSAFENNGDWQNIKSDQTVNSVKKEVCLNIGACVEEQFQFQDKPLIHIQSHWDAKCFVCQAFARDLEVLLNKL